MSAERRYQLSLPDELPDTLLARRMLAELPPIAGAATAARLAVRARAPATRAAEELHWQRFVDFCEAQRVESLPAAVATVWAYVGHLSECGTLAADSLQPLLTAVANAHRDAGLVPPCGEAAVDDHVLRRVRDGLAHEQTALPGGTRDTRIPAPATVVERAILEVPPSASAAVLRSHAATAVAALFGGRGDTVAHLRAADVGFGGGLLWCRLTEKGKRKQVWRRVVRVPIGDAPSSAAADGDGGGGPSVLPAVGALLRRYDAAWKAAWAAARSPLPEWYWQLPGERARPMKGKFSAWFVELLERLGVRAPDGFCYSGHSLRATFASAASAIRLDLATIKILGGWSPTSRTVERDYIDPTFARGAGGAVELAACRRLYGWLLDHRYEIGDREAAAPPLPDPLLEGARGA